MAPLTSKLGSDAKEAAAARRKGRMRSPLETIGIALTEGERAAHAAWRERATALGPADDRHRALYVTALGTGLRQVELLGLRWED